MRSSRTPAWSSLSSTGSFTAARSSRSKQSRIPAQGVRRAQGDAGGGAEDSRQEQEPQEVVRIAPQHLRRLRNEVDIAGVIHDLEIPTRKRGGWLRFLCPLCGEFDTATSPTTNLARCFRCRRNFNPIDLVMIERRVSFLQAVAYLQKRVKPAERRAFWPAPTWPAPVPGARARYRSRRRETSRND